MSSAVKEGGGGATKGTPPSSGPSSPPLIPLSVVDGPTQRVYLASAFLLLETYKLYQVLADLYSPKASWTLVGSFWLANLVFISAASRLRVPRLAFTKARWILIYLLLGFLDWAACGGWRTMFSMVHLIPVLGWLSNYISEAYNGAFDREISFSEHRVRLKDLIEPKHHILGQHTIHVLPHSTASLTPLTSTSSLASCFCLDMSNPKAEVLIPIHFNNTDPHWLSYSVTPFESDAEPSIYNVTISKSSLTRLGGISESREMTKKREDQLDLELEDADDQKRSEQDDSLAVARRGGREVQSRPTSSRVNSSPHASSRSRQHADSGLLYHLAVRQVGRVRLERVLDRNRYDARLSRSEVMVVECPSMAFKRSSHDSCKDRAKANQLQHHCPSEEGVLDVQVRGLAPLELHYSRHIELNQARSRNNAVGQKDHFTLSRISGNSTGPSPLPFEDRLALALNTKQPPGEVSFDWAIAREINLPVTIEFTDPGKYHYELDQVKDACGNTFRADKPESTLHEEVEVHPRSQVSFVACNEDNPITLLKGGVTKELFVQRGSTGPQSESLDVQVRFQGADEEWQRSVTLTGQRASLAVEKPGTYSLEGVRGQYCAGEVASPWMCIAKEIAPPTSIIEVDPIQDQCAGPVGVKALAILSGTPPFKLKYTIQSKGSPATTHERRIDQTREEIEFRPTADGEITYTFVGLSDANYKDIALDGPSFRQVLHPIAKAAFASSPESRGPYVVLHGCEGNKSTAKVHLEGVGPFELSYAVRTSGGELAYTNKVKGITTNEYLLTVEVPKPVADRGGILTVTLTSIKDAKGCERPLTSSDLTIDVRRSKPSITFVDPRETHLLEGGEARLPVRLAGDGPWKVRYQRDGDAGPPVSHTLSKSESVLVVDKPGTYTLLDVSDQHCPGSVVEAKKSYHVSLRPRPKAVFQKDASSEEGQGGVLSRKSVCVGVQDAVNMRLTGQYPIEVAYQHLLPSKGIVKERFTSAQNVAKIQLYTGSPGLHSYTLTEVGDAVYSDGVELPRTSGTQLTQEVLALPSATFPQLEHGSASKVESSAASLCVGDSLSQKQTAGGKMPTATLTLTGKAPFSLEVEIKDGLGVLRKTIRRSGISKQQYNLEIGADEFVFGKTGRWSVEVVRVEDANGCYRDLRKASAAGALGEDEVASQRQVRASSFTIDVVETANITAVDSRSDHCVGDTIEYALQGAAPWTVVYDFEGATSNAAVRSSTFARVAERPGKLTIKRIAHQQNKCENNVQNQDGMVKTIHALPSVYVREGKHYIEDVREGNQAEIVFKLQGTPPFTFSIQRTQAVTRFETPTVLESYSVTGIMDTSYHIYTADEGTWSVTWLKDRYCEVSLVPPAVRR